MILLFNIKTRTPKKVLTKISHPQKVTTKFQPPKKFLDRKFQTEKRALHIPVTYIPEYPPPPPGPAGLSLYSLPQKYKSGPNNWRQKSANPALCPHMSPGSTPLDGR